MSFVAWSANCCSNSASCLRCQNLSRLSSPINFFQVLLQLLDLLLLLGVQLLEALDFAFFVADSPLEIGHLFLGLESKMLYSIQVP